MPELRDRSAVKILEIARTGYLKGLFTGDVVRFDLYPYGNESSAGMGGLSSLYRTIAKGGFDLIVCEPNFRAPWHPLALFRILFSRRALSGKASISRPFGLQMLRQRQLPPIAVVDLEDSPSINRCDRYLLDRCQLYFKRELPVDGWRVFANTMTPRLPTLRFRSNAANLARVAKLRPVSLGIPPGIEAMLPDRPRDKTVDVFFAGDPRGLPARENGLAELAELRAQGVVVDVPDRRLDRQEFYQRCAGARLVWSPEGYGWDCFRHYEAAACGSVPLINYPSIQRYRPLQDGTHCLYYAPEPGGLSQAILGALQDKAKLAAMAENARDHATRFHRREIIGRHIVDSCLSPDGGSDQR
jgi:glycosyltransferase involved in cell wall biosynthesis